MREQSLRKNAEEFVLYKQSIGYIYEDASRVLDHFVSFAEKENSNAPYLQKGITDAFLSTISYSDSQLYITVSLLREFGRYLQARGYYDAYVIPPKVTQQPTPEAPYFFTLAETEAFFESLDSIEPHKSFPGRELVFPALFRLLYCCGLRCKEARTLECVNVHTDELYLDIIQSKGPKSRRIFISEELAKYLDDYDARIAVLFPDRKYYFPHGNHCYSCVSISQNFRRFWLKAFPDFQLKTRPRAYDFRHHFAWTNINRWASEGMDVNAMLPYLMRYMGHQSVKETLYYFHFVPEFFPTYQNIAGLSEDLIPEVPDES